MAEPQRKKSPRGSTPAPAHFIARLADHSRNRLPAVDIEGTENVDAQDRNPIAPEAAESSLAQLAERLIQEYHIPVYVIVDEQYNVIYTSAHTGRFVESPRGESHDNVVNTAHPDLRMALRATVRQALGRHQVRAHDTITMHLDGQARRVRLVVRPLLDTAGASNLLLVLFEDMDPVGAGATAGTSPHATNPSAAVIQRLESELRSSRAHLQATIAELETSNAELSAANQELIAINGELQAANEELATLLDLLPIGIGICEDGSCRRMRLNRVGCEILGVAPGTMMAVHGAEPWHSPLTLYRDGQGMRAHDLPLQRAVQTREVVRDVEFLLVREDGCTMSLLLSAAPPARQQNGAIGAVMAFVDITQHKRMQFEAESFARQQFNVVQLGMRALGDADASTVMDEAVAIVRETLDVELCGIFERLSGGESLRLHTGLGWPAELIGQATLALEGGSLVDFTLRRADPVVFADMSQDNRFPPAPLLLEQGVVSGMGVAIHNHRHPYGMLGAYTTQPRQFTPNEGFFLHTIAHVLTMALHRRHIEEERRREQLQRAERLASIGTLAAGIAHEMNNPLNTVMLSADHALSLLPPENPQSQDEIASALRDILQETERCSTIIRNILRFTRNETTHKDAQNLNDVVQRFVQLGPQYLSRPSLPLTYIPGGNLPPVMLNATEIEHVLANLVENALNTADDVHVTLCTEFDGVQVRLLVHDNGPGIRQEDIPYIFDPFYSTRRQRGGIGLGLSIVHAIVADHQGVIHVVSKPGQDTTFVLMFPPAGVEFTST